MPREKVHQPPAVILALDSKAREKMGALERHNQVRPRRLH
jgi:hypothetical protein